MAKMRRFISRGESWNNGAVILDREGKEFDVEKDAELIALIVRDGINGGGLVIEVPTSDALQQAAAELLLADAQVQKLVEQKAAFAAVAEAATAGGAPTVAGELDAEEWARQAGATLDVPADGAPAPSKKRKSRQVRSDG